MWRVAEPNEALVISGLREHSSPEGAGESMGFRIVTGKGTLVLPGIQTVRRLSLDLREAPLSIECVTHQGIPLGIQGVVIFKVGDDYVSIANAARRFLDQQQQMDAGCTTCSPATCGRSGNMTVEEMIRDREKLTSLTRQSSGSEMEKLGLIVDSSRCRRSTTPPATSGTWPCRTRPRWRGRRASPRPTPTGRRPPPSRGPTPSRPRPGARA